MHNETSPSNSDPNPLAEQWQEIERIQAETAHQDAEYEQSLSDIDQLLADIKRQDAEYEALMADIEHQDAEYKALVAEEHRQEELDRLEDIRFTFSTIDFNLSNIDPDPRLVLNNLIGFIGVYADIKPLAIDHIILDPDTFADESHQRTSALEEIQKNLSSLGITFTYAEHPAPKGHPATVSWYASKDPQLIQEFQNIQNQYRNASPAERDAITRRQGQLLGYPPTATEYFIAHSHAREKDPDLPLIDGGIGSKFSRCEYVHSPEHAEEEYVSYEKPLYAALRQYLPESSTLLDQQISPSVDLENS